MKSLRFALPVAFAALVGLVGCADDNTLIKSKIQVELDACQRATADDHEVKFKFGKPYVMSKSLCGEPIRDIVFQDEIKATAWSGPYEFALQKDLGDGRWHLNRVAWPDLDQARSLFEFPTISDDDYKKIDGLLAKAEVAAPKMAEIKLKRLDVKLRQRKRTDKNAEADRTALGVADTYYKTATAASADNPDLNLGLRLLVLGYYSRFHDLAVASSTPSESAAEFEVGAIKAIQNDADDAKKKNDTATYDKKIAEIKERTAELEVNAKQRVKDAETMAALSKVLKKRLCDEVKAAQGIAATDNDGKEALAGYASGCAP